ncbi:MAG: glycosyltransferase family 4 protein [Magnetococcales bacterium]|nr:glycosyltransferase family 4 protein [Magnetococcales bacterium]
MSLVSAHPSQSMTTNLALVRQRYTPYGGAERFVDRALETLQRQGINVAVVARHWRDQPPDGIRIMRCNPFYWGRLWRDWGFARSIQQQWLGRPEWLVQSHERIPGCHLYRAGDGVHAQWLQNRRRTQTAWQRFATWANPYHRYLLTMEHRMMTHPNLRAIICNSRMVRDEIKHWFQVPDSKLHVIHSGVDTIAFHPRSGDTLAQQVRKQWDIPLNATLFLFVGSGYARKGLTTLLHAILKVDNAWLMVVGRDSQEKHYKRLVARLNLAQRVRLAGGCQDVRPFYAAADAVVLPTLYDPFPNVALEAMACALPLVTSFQSGASDFLNNGHAGLLCDALDVETLSAHLHDLMDPRRRQHLGQQGRALAETLTWEQMGRQLKALYQHLLVNPDGR